MSNCDRVCIPFSLYDPELHTLNGVYATEEECLAACECEEASTNGQSSSVSSQFDSIVQSSSSVSGQSSSSNVSSNNNCADNQANLQINGDFEVSAGIWENFDNEIFTPVGNAAAGLWPPVGDRAWTSSTGNFYIKFNGSAPNGGWWELIAFERISHKAFLNGAAPETSRPWNVTFVHAPSGSEPDPSATLSVTRVCPQPQAGSSSSSSRAPFFTCEPEDASIRLTADFKFGGSSGQLTAVNNLILSRSSAPLSIDSPVSWSGTTNGRTIYILFIQSQNQGDYWNRWLIGWPHPNTAVSQFIVAYRSDIVTDPPPLSWPWLISLVYEGVEDHEGIALSALNVEKYCI